MGVLNLILGAAVCWIVWFVGRELYRWYYYGPPKGVRSPPLGVPVYGHMFQVMKARSRFEFLEKWVAEYEGPNKVTMVRLPIAENGYAYLITDYQAVKDIMLHRPHTFRRSRIFEQATITKAGLFGLNDPVEWGRIRRLTAPAFSHGNVNKMLPALNKIARTLVGKWSRLAEQGGSSTELDCLKDFYAYTFDVISLVGFNHHINALEDSDNPLLADILVLMRSIQERVWRLLPFRRPSKRLIEAATRFMGLIEETRREAMEGGSQDVQDDTNRRGYATLMAKMVSALDNESDRARMSVDDLLANMLTFYMAGTDTTANTLTWALHHLSNNPDMQERAHAEVTKAFPGGVLNACDTLEGTTALIEALPYCRALVYESLRLTGPAPLVVSVSRKPVTVCGFDFPEGSTFTLMLRAIYTNDEYFPRGKEFLPERWLDGSKDSVTGKPLVPEDPDVLKVLKNAPFGGGPRICPGKELALDEATLAIAAVMENFTVSSAVGVEPPYETTSFTMKPSHGIVRIQSRNRSVVAGG